MRVIESGLSAAYRRGNIIRGLVYRRAREMIRNTPTSASKD